MHYALLIYEDEAGYQDEQAIGRAIAAHEAFSGSIAANSRGGAGLANSDAATSVRTTGGRQTLHDGPFAETKEQLGGIYIIEADDLDAAIAIARQVPLLGDGCIEVRPVIDGTSSAPAA
jgi:hypothetical protein